MATPRRRQSCRRTSPPASPGCVPEDAAPSDPGTGDGSRPARTIAPRERAALSKLLKHLGKESRRLHGGPLKPGDPLFPELETMGPEEIAEMVARTMEHEGIDPARIYAFRKTGLLVTGDETLQLLSEADRRAWNGAVQQYRDRQD